MRMIVNEDLVFTGFVLKNPQTDTEYSSKELGLYRVSNNNRYTENITPSFEDKIVHVPGQKGSYYFGTKYRDKTIPVQVAFDNLTIEQFNDITQIFEDLVMQEEPFPLQLIFDETPYKMNLVYLQNPPTFSYIPFDENGETILKGEGTINFICFEPFARSVDRNNYLTPRVNNGYLQSVLFSNEGGQEYSIPFTHKVLFSTEKNTLSSNQIVNIGDLPISPLIKITGTNLTNRTAIISCGKGSGSKFEETNWFIIRVTKGSTVVYIDTANCIAYDENFNFLEIKYDHNAHYNTASAHIEIPSIQNNFIKLKDPSNTLYSEISDERRDIIQENTYTIYAKEDETTVASGVAKDFTSQITLIYDYLYM